MSNAVYPTLTGLTFNVKKSPQFHTETQRAVSGMEARAAFMAYPLWTFGLSYDMLRRGTFQGAAYTEFDNLVGFFAARRGSYDSFLFTDPEGHLVGLTQASQ